ncbi:ABC transporter ATP-binding protein [Miniimonas arenae]|uniref:ABC transporter ATP-binding protein n=1 Tax=Miniimonas arenae TaxID=676201 RepID=A0A5C5BCY3_9MICO|nr:MULTISPECIES: ABC transporter ATP-binding protein [Miniimonas]TNU73716.1 ABC transporter ATP-binding protein [Miniimonas arenae]
MTSPVPPRPPADPGSVPALHTWGLFKRFGPKTAVEQFELVIPTGSYFGLVGPNGAGKTTTLSMATGLLQPDAGTAFVHGVDVWRDPATAKRQLGILPDGLRLFDRLTGAELVTYAGLLRGMDPDVVRRRTDDLLDVLGLTGDANKLVADYSAGMTKKIGLATALVHAPSVLVLDEPFESVDPVSASHIRAILADYVANGGTVVLSSHVMELVERLCSHVAVMTEGRLVASGTVAEVGGGDLQRRFAELVGAEEVTEGLSWLRPSRG